MENSYFDIVVGAVVLLLGLKGLINGFFKELFGLVGIIGGIFVASRFGNAIGEYLNSNILHFENSAMINFAGFLGVLAIFWFAMIAIGNMFKKLSSASGLGAVDRIFGFVVGSSKFFLIAAVIAYSLNNIDAIKDKLQPQMKHSFLFPVMVEVGGIIMHIDTTKFSGKVGETIDSGVEKTTQTLNEQIDKQAQDLANSVKDGLK
ncbi:MAG: CvpA family protein [Campylobacterota bacterium]|nr:CvpA family protein [Campylobacterota bacterium]